MHHCQVRRATHAPRRGQVVVVMLVVYIVLVRLVRAHAVPARSHELRGRGRDVGGECDGRGRVRGVNERDVHREEHGLFPGHAGRLLRGRRGRNRDGTGCCRPRAGTTAGAGGGGRVRDGDEALDGPLRVVGEVDEGGGGRGGAPAGLEDGQDARATEALLRKADGSQLS
ncbi:hypothetical protein C8Q77DRAFT_788945 [Trametes polyzona]|nr:hypothetical protein C8Q77DRAFT_788945 [Trametes polyzona]